MVLIDDQTWLQGAIKACLGNISKTFLRTAYCNQLKSSLVTSFAKFCQNVVTMVSINQYISIMLMSIMNAKYIKQSTSVECPIYNVKSL